MDIKALLEFLKKNNASEETIKYVEELKLVDVNTVKDFLNNDADGQKFLKSHTDSQVTKGIDTFKEKTMPGLIEDEIKKQFPAETEEQKKMRELENNQKKLEGEIKQKDLLNDAISYATEKGLPTKFIGSFIGEDKEATIANIDSFGETYSGAITKAVEDKFKENGRSGSGSGEDAPGQDYEKMTDEEYYNSRLEDEKNR